LLIHIFVFENKFQDSMGLIKDGVSGEDTA